MNKFPVRCRDMRDIVTLGLTGHLTDDHLRTMVPPVTILLSHYTFFIGVIKDAGKPPSVGSNELALRSTFKTEEMLRPKSEPRSPLGPRNRIELTNYLLSGYSK